MNNSNNTNIDQAEVSKFSSLANVWWDPHGPSEPLHILNPTRLSYIQQHVELAGKRVLDYGCGAGILSESMAKDGAIVCGFDASAAMIEVAKAHAAQMDLSIDYLTEPPTGQFDIITCMELIEHVPDPTQLIQDCANLLNPGGKLFISTINRSLKAYALAIIGAEYILQILPKNTHKYSKFIQPAELAESCRANQLRIEGFSGIEYSPFTKSAVLCQDLAVNYIAHATKEH